LNLPLAIPPTSKSTESGDPAASSVRVRIDAPDLCPHYTARLIRGVKIAPSPPAIARRLEAVGVRPINNIVDVTNYVLFELGQPLHAFDFAKISGGQIIVRNAARGEVIVSIDGRKRELSPSMLVIVDAARPLALAGVMGGLESEVTDSTVDVLLESARFDPLSIRRTARALTMKSDSSYLFERGIDPALPARASLRAAQLILETAGGQLAGGVVQAGSDQITPRQIVLRFSQLRRILGVDLPPGEVLAAFSRLGFSPTQSSPGDSIGGDSITVIVPSFRLDISEEIDLVEEAARLLGYDRISTRPEVSIQLSPPDRTAVTVENICDVMVGGGYFEAVTFSFISDSLRNDFGTAPFRADASVRKADAALRPSLIPGLLQAVRFNETNGNSAPCLFEIGSTFGAESNGGLTEKRRIAWVGGDLRQVRGMAETILARLDADHPLTVTPDSHPGFAAGAVGRLVWKGQSIGYLGEIDRAVAGKLSLRDIPAAAEIDLAPLLAGARDVPQLKPLSRFPAVQRDVSLVVAENIRFEKVESLVRGLNLPFLESIEFVTTFRGKPLEAGFKSVTIALVFRSPSATLTGEQVEDLVQTAIEAAKKTLGATLRA